MQTNFASALETIHNLCRSRISQTFASTTTQLFSNRSEAIEWCIVYHAPFITASAPSPGFKNLPPLYATYGINAPFDFAWGQGRRVNLFLGSTGRMTLVSRAATLIQEDVTNNRYLITGDALYAWIPTFCADGMRQPARLIRERLITGALDTAALRLHAGVAFIAGASYLLLGPSGSGKTSFLLQCIRAGDGLFCSNDRVLISSMKGEIVAYGVPLAIRVGIDNMRWFPQLNEFIAQYHSKSLLKRAAPSRRSGFTKFALTPQELASLLGVELVPKTILAGVIVPKLSSSYSGKAAITPVRFSDRLGTLTKGILFEDPYFPPPLSKRGCDSRKEVVKTTIDALLRLPWYLVEGAFDDPTLNILIRTVIPSSGG